uniref:THH1/TOM1/TOM3 domain-containing protein n=1 Tax=Brassica oleracea var. oleracea TaxID=109376 RepID=A0A0D3BI90_BRAOL
MFSVWIQRRFCFLSSKSFTEDGFKEEADDLIKSLYCLLKLDEGVGVRIVNCSSLVDQSKLVSGTIVTLQRTTFTIIRILPPKARSLPTDKLRITYISVNVAVYLAQVVIWVFIWVNDNSTVELVGKIFMSVVSFIAALGFLLYGGRLFIMLIRFPIESKGRRKKLHEVVTVLVLLCLSFTELCNRKVIQLQVGSVTAICFTCFLIRCIVGFQLSLFIMNSILKAERESQPRTGRINFIGDSRNHIQPESEERHGCVGGGGDGLRPRRNNEAVDVKVEDNQNGAEKSRGGAAGAERLQRM